MRVKRTNIVNQAKEQTERRLSEAQKSATHLQRGVEKTHKIAEKRRKMWLPRIGDQRRWQRLALSLTHQEQAAQMKKIEYLAGFF